ncbi:diguanylate cyclase [Arcobacter sp. s6]|uniref:diguanylate cyclase domain-containing protein n=1 Tax=Arcobacter sp. s6 TaxID=3230363 RepID=UPI0034A05660
MEQKIILVIDDEPTNIAIVTELLNSLYQIRVSTNGKNALEIVSKEKPDLILLDISMPQMNGYEVADKLKSSVKTSNIPFIFLTAKNDSQSMIEGFFKGAVDYISKPFSKEELLARVETHLKLNELQNSLKETVDEVAHYLELMDQNIISSSTDLEGIITNVSTAFCNICGFSKEELITKSHDIVKHEDMQKEIYDDLWKTINQNLVWKGELKNKKKDGTSYWVDITIYPDFDKTSGEKIGYTSIRHDISDKKRIEELSIHDELTKLYNRRHFNKVLHDEINRAKRDKKILSFMMLDVDYFKLYNDNYGHQQGDNVLSETGKVLTSYCKRAGDFAFRLGGEEFGIIFSEVTKEESKNYANAIKKAIENLRIPHIKNPISGVITISIGLLSIFPNEKISENEIYKKTDDLLYKAKESGRNTVCSN